MQRSTRKLSLTAAGAAFFERCAPAVGWRVGSGKGFGGGSQTASGTVRVAAPADFLDFFEDRMGDAVLGAASQGAPGFRC